MTPKEASRSEPLSPEEEAECRRIFLTPSAIIKAERAWQARLLATLDAARAEAEARFTEEETIQAALWAVAQVRYDSSADVDYFMLIARIRAARRPR